MRRWRQRKSGDIPEVDERSVFLMQRYFAIVLYTILFGSGAVLLLLYAMGVHAIDTGLLIVCLMVIFTIIGLGALIIKRL